MLIILFRVLSVAFVMAEFLENKQSMVENVLSFWLSPDGFGYRFHLSF